MGKRSPWRARSQARALGAGAMLVLMLGGCGGEPDAEESRVSLDSSREQVETRFGDAVEALQGAGFEVTEAKGRWSSCQMEPESAMEFYASGAVTGGSGDPVARVDAAADALEGDGWEPEAASETPRPYATFSDGDLRLSVSKSKFSDDLALSVTGACIPSTTDQENERLGQKFDLS